MLAVNSNSVFSSSTSTTSAPSSSSFAAAAAAENFPPFPSRLMQQQQYPLPQYTLNSKRRVRPIAVPPPPGFAHVPANLSAHAHSQQQPVNNTSYMHQVKMRAIAGALAGDWSVNRSLPDIPSFLLTHLLLHFDVSSPAVLDLSSQDLATFCLQNNIHSNITSPVFNQPTSQLQQQQSGSSFASSNSNNNLMSKSNDDFDLMNDILNRVACSSSYSSTQTPGKRRLAPIKITTEALFNSGGGFGRNNAGGSDAFQFLPQPHNPLAYSNAPVIVKPLSSHFNPTINQPATTVSGSETSFHKTPRAPKDVAKEELYNCRPREFGVFPTATAASLSSASAYSTDAEFSVNFADIPAESPVNFANADDLSNLARPKIPPPQPSSPARRRSQRLKQIHIGKNTPEYKNYLALVAMNERRRGDPVTPDIEQEISKRNWEGQVRKWRRMLHEFDPPAAATAGTDDTADPDDEEQEEVMAEADVEDLAAEDSGDSRKEFIDAVKETLEAESKDLETVPENVYDVLAEKVDEEEKENVCILQPIPMHKVTNVAAIDNDLIGDEGLDISEVSTAPVQP